MNNNFNIPFIPINNINQNIYEELKRLNYNLEQINKYLEKENYKQENKYLKKDDTYHII